MIDIFKLNDRIIDSGIDKLKYLLCESDKPYHEEITKKGYKLYFVLIKEQTRRGKKNRFIPKKYPPNKVDEII